MSARTMQRILRQARSEALELADIDAIDSRRMRMLTAHTHEFIEEAWHLFTAISGRLYALAYHLEELQEFEAARRYLALLDMERIDEALSAFRRFRQSFDAAEQPEMVLVMKGVETSRRIQRLFAAPKLAEVIEPSLLQRADRVLTDLLSSVRGLRFASGAEAVDVNAVISGIADRFGSFRVDDQAMLDAVDDPDRYVAALASRLSVPLAYRGVRWDCTLASGLPPADVQRERLGDIVTSVAEDLVSAGAREIHAATGFARGSIAITLQAPGIRAPGAMEDSRIALFDRTLATVGGALERLPVAGASAGVALRLPVS